MKFELLGYISNINVLKAVLYSFSSSSDSSSSEETDSDSSHVFTCGNRKRHIVPESQFDFDDQDLAVAGNVDGIGNLATFSIPETQMEDRSVKSYTLEIT